MSTGRRSLRRVTFAAIVALSAAGVALTLAMPSLRLRSALILMKATGRLPDLTWARLLTMMAPDAPYWLQPLVETGNPYVAIANPYPSSADEAAGAALFRANCASCHGANAAGGTEGTSDLTAGEFRHGASDWALFRTIGRGVPGTSMRGFDLTDREVWQLVSYVRSVSGARKPNVAASVEETIRPVTADRLLRAGQAPPDWLTYSGTYDGRRFSALSEIRKENVWQLALRWQHRLGVGGDPVQATPLVVDGIMFVTQPRATVKALDAKSGELLWSYGRETPDDVPLCCGNGNRGVAVLGDLVFFGTLDAHLVALRAATGEVVWDVKVAEHREGYSITGAPLAVRDMVLTGIAGGEFGIRGFIDAYDAATGARRWRFHTVPAPGEPGHLTWAGDSWKRGGAPTWLTGSFDPDLNLVYWGVGNPAPNFAGEVREGDNLYSNSVVALDAGSGTLRWHFQFTPHDEHDWDAVQIPVLLDAEFRGAPRRLLAWANRNAFYYLLDRTDGRFLFATPFARQTWASAIDASGRPIVRPGSSPSVQGALVYPGSGGATNWWSPSFSASTGLLYIPVMDQPSIFFKGSPEFRIGERFLGGRWQAPPGQRAQTAVRAVEPLSGRLEWEYVFSKQVQGDRLSTGGILSTAGGLVLAGDRQELYALDDRSGQPLWKVTTGGTTLAGPVTYMVDGEQLITVTAGRALMTFGLPRKSASPH